MARKTISLHLPETKDFAHLALKKLFDPRLVEELVAFETCFRQLDAQAEQFKERYSAFPALEERLHVALERLGERLVIAGMTRGKPGRDLLFACFHAKKYGLDGKRCHLCRAKARLQECHIIRRAFFRKYKKGVRAYDTFKNHYANLLLLCPTCHDALDHGGKLHQGKLKRLVKQRRMLLKDMIAQLKTECGDLRRFTNLLKETETDLEKKMKAVFTQRLRKYL